MVGRGVDAALWHYPKGFLPFGRQVRTLKVGTIADTILQFYADNYPQFRSRLGYRYWIAMLKNAVRHFDLILTVSEFSKRSILEFAARYHLKEPKIAVTYQAVDVEQASSRQQEDYVLHLASTQPHKRTNWLLKEWRKLQSSDASLPQLRLIGRLGAEAEEIAAKLSNTRILPTTTREQVVEAMSGALALILPSEIEGFGLPALEAYAVGTPVVYVRNTAVEEILGLGSPGCFPLQEPGALRDALIEVLAMDAAQIQRKGHELQERFSWQKCVELTVAGYRSLN
jgi:glycosyltransferase involved in cell wall biosynthesis